MIDTSSAAHAGAAAQTVVSHPVVQAVVNQVKAAATPDHIHSLGVYTLSALTGVGASIVHSLLKKDKWSPKLNNLLALAYCAVIATLDVWLKGLLDLSNFALAFLTVYGSAQAWYSLLFVINQSEQKAALPTTTNP